MLCSVVIWIGVLSLLVFGGLTSWIHYPVWWNWHRRSADWDAVWARARRIGWWRWFFAIGVAVFFFLMAAVLDCPSD